MVNPRKPDWDGIVALYNKGFGPKEIVERTGAQMRRVRDVIDRARKAGEIPPFVPKGTKRLSYYGVKTGHGLYRRIPNELTDEELEWVLGQIRGDVKNVSDLVMKLIRDAVATTHSS